MCALRGSWRNREGRRQRRRRRRKRSRAAGRRVVRAARGGARGRSGGGGAHFLDFCPSRTSSMTSPSSPVTPRAARAREGECRREREERRENDSRERRDDRFSGDDSHFSLINRGSLDDLERCRRPIEGSRRWASQGLTFSATWFRGRRGLSVAGGGRAQRLARPTPETRQSPQCPASPPPSSRPSLPRRHPGARASPPRVDRARPPPPGIGGEQIPASSAFFSDARSIPGLPPIPSRLAPGLSIPLARRRARDPRVAKVVTPARAPPVRSSPWRTTERRRSSARTRRRRG